jgi:hypothetical protein
MTLNELKGKYAHLSQEIDTLAADGGHHEARLRLMDDLDQVHRELCELRQRTFSAPTLRDVVSWSDTAVARPVLSMAG